jgi:hypothetical protein
VHVADIRPGLAARALQAILQQEHPHEVAGALGGEELRDRAGFGLEGRISVRAVARPQLNDGVRGRVVLAPRAPCDLSDQRAPHQGPQRRAAQEPLHEGCPPGRRRREQQLARGATELGLRHQPIDEPQTPRLVASHGLAGQHHLHGGAHPRDTHAANRAAEARVDAELHLREPQREGLAGDADAIAAGEGQLEAAAEGKAVNGRDTRAGEPGQAIEDLLTAMDELVAAGGVRDAREFLDVGAGDEAALLGGDHDHPARPIPLERSEQPVELGEHAAREHVRRGAGLVDREPRETLGVTRERPGSARRVVHAGISLC